MARAIVRDLHSGTAAARLLSRLVLVMGVAPILAPLVGVALLQALGPLLYGVSAAASGLVSVAHDGTARPMAVIVAAAAILAWIGARSARAA